MYVEDRFAKDVNCVESFSSRGSLTHEAKQIRGSLVLAYGCQGAKRGVAARSCSCISEVDRASP